MFPQTERKNVLICPIQLRWEESGYMRDSIIITIATSGVQSHLILWNQNIPFLGASGVNLRLNPNIRHDRFRLVLKVFRLSLKRFSLESEGSSRLLWTLSKSADFPPSNYSRFIVSVQLGGHMAEALWVRRCDTVFCCFSGRWVNKSSAGATCSDLLSDQHPDSKSSQSTAQKLLSNWK